MNNVSKVLVTLFGWGLAIVLAVVTQRLYFENVRLEEKVRASEQQLTSLRNVLRESSDEAQGIAFDEVRAGLVAAS